MRKILFLMTLLLVAVAVKAFDGTKYYVINKNGNTSAYMYASGTQILAGALADSDANYIWQLIPTETENGYYLKNVGTGQYAQTSNNGANNTIVLLGDNPLEYIVSTGAGTTGTQPTYFLASNDQGTIDYSQDATVGLNYLQSYNQVVGYYIKTGRGNSYWNITETDYDPTPKTHTFSADKYYNITWNGNSGSYMTEVIGGKLQVAGKSDAAKQAWILIPTEKNECYYIQNAISDKYIQTCNMTNSNQSLVSLGTSPVEYYITKGSGTTASVYRLTSTDCTGYDDTSASPHGLNKDGASDNIIVWQAGATNTGSYWNLTETTFDREAYDKAQEELKKDPCKSLAVVSLPCTTLSKDTYLSRIDITGEGAQDSLHYISGTPSSAYNLYSKVRATLIRGSEAYLGARLVGKSISGLSVALYADYDGDGNLEDTTRVVSLTDSLTFSLLVPVSTTSTQGRLRIVVDQSGSDDPNEAYGTIYDLPFYIIDKGDVNGDRLVDVGDETVLTEILKGNAVEVPAADVDHNGKVDAKDSKALESLILK